MAAGTQLRGIGRRTTWLFLGSIRLTTPPELFGSETTQQYTCPQVTADDQCGTEIVAITRFVAGFMRCSVSSAPTPRPFKTQSDRLPKASAVGPRPTKTRAIVLPVPASTRLTTPGPSTTISPPRPLCQRPMLAIQTAPFPCRTACGERGTRTVHRRRPVGASSFTRVSAAKLANQTERASASPEYIGWSRSIRSRTLRSRTSRAASRLGVKSQTVLRSPAIGLPLRRVPNVSRMRPVTGSTAITPRGPVVQRPASVAMTVSARPPPSAHAFPPTRTTTVTSPISANRRTGFLRLTAAVASLEHSTWLNACHHLAVLTRPGLARQEFGQTFRPRRRNAGSGPVFGRDRAFRAQHGDIATGARCLQNACSSLVRASGVGFRRRHDRFEPLETGGRPQGFHVVVDLERWH